MPKYVALNNQKVTFAVCGAGHIGKRHAEMIVKNQQAHLAAIIDTNTSLKEELSKLYHEVPFFSSLENFLDSPVKADVLVVSTPNGCHTSQAIAGISSGMHVVIEKPMGLSKESCAMVIQEAEKHHKQVFCVMQNRYSPPSQWLKGILDKGCLGNVYMVNVNCFWNRDSRYYHPEGWHGKLESDGGTLFTQFSHFIDLMYWLFGDISEIKANFEDFNHHHLTEFEDSGNIIFKYTKGGMGSLNYSTSLWDKNFESSVTIIAERGTVKVGGQYMEKVEYCHIENYEMPHLPPTNPSNNYGQYSGSASNHQYIIQNVIDVLNGKESITTNAAEGMKVVEIIERIYEQKNLS